MTWLRGGVTALALSLSLGGCTSVTGTEYGGATPNLPSIGVTPQGVGFSVVARNFSYEDTYAAPTVGDSLVVGLSVLNYGGGSVLVEVTDSTGATKLQQTVQQNLAQGQTTIAGTPPYAVHILFTGFTGTFALGVAASTS